MGEEGGQRCCCGCCTVRTGTKIIAVLCIIGSVYTIVTQIASLVLLSRDSTEFAAYTVHVAQLKEAFRGYREPMIARSAVGLVLALVQLILSGLLLHGAHTGQERQCRPWLCYNYFFFVVFCVMLFIAFVYLLFINIMLAIYLAIGAVVGLTINGYLLVVVARFTEELTGATEVSGIVNKVDAEF